MALYPHNEQIYIGIACIDAGGGVEKSETKGRRFTLDSPTIAGVRRGALYSIFGDVQTLWKYVLIVSRILGKTIEARVWRRFLRVAGEKLALGAKMGHSGLRCMSWDDKNQCPNQK